MIRRAWRRWVAWWSVRERPEALAAFRIAVGLTTAATWLSLLGTGVGEAMLASVEHGGLAPRDAPPGWLDALAGGATPEAVVGLLALGTVSALAVSLGLGGRWSALVAGQVAMVLFALHPGTGGGHDRLITNALWLLVLGDATATWSLDARLSRGRWARPEVRIGALPRRLAVFQLVLMYTLTGLDKQGASWGAAGDWRAVHDSLLMVAWTRVDLAGVLPSVFGLTQVATVLTWWWEAGWVLLLPHAWLRGRPADGSRLARWAQRVDLRIPFVVLGGITHGILWLTMNLGPFTAITWAYYLALWTGHDADRHLGPAPGGPGVTSPKVVV